MEILRETTTLWSAETRRTLRSTRALILLGLYALFTALMLLFSRGLSSLLVPSGMDAMTDDQLGQMRSAAIAVLFSPDLSLIDSLLAFPVPILVTFKSTLVFLPFYIAIIGFDQLSGEVGPKSIRYLTLRARRSSILLGKFLAQQSVLVALALIVNLGLLAYARFGMAEEIETKTLLLGLLRFWIAAAVFSVPYSALTALCSTAFRQPVVSLVMNLLVLPPIFLLAKIPEYWIRMNRGIGGAPPEEEILSPVAHLRLLSPWHYADNLLHPALSTWSVSAAAHVVFAALFLGIAYAVLRQRDL